jgi:hypothetical protein
MPRTPRTHHRGKPAHSITEVNLETKTGTCAICGPNTPLSIVIRKGYSKWVAICRRNQMEKRNQLRRGERPPIKIPRHCISNINEADKTGTCSICGEVELRYVLPDSSKPNGRDGYWACRKKQQELQKACNLRRTRTHESSVHGMFSITSGSFAYPGLTPAHLKKCWEVQEGKCAICNTDLDRKYHIDHCHTEMMFRGLLCRFCNTGLGLFKDSQTNLARAITYLASPPLPFKLRDPGQ